MPGFAHARAKVNAAMVESLPLLRVGGTVLIIFGTRRSAQRLAVLTLTCGQCGNHCAHPLWRMVTKFTLFFIPLFPVRSEYQVQCTYCGVSSRISKDQARELSGSS